MSIRVFFTSVPSYYSQAELLDFFRTYAPIKKLDLRNNKNTPHSKGYGVLTLWNQNDLEYLLDSDIVLEGRQIILQIYLSGKELKEKQKKVKDCRVVIKNVPRCVSDQKLVKIFSRFGRVVSAFCVVKNQVRKPYGYVTFTNTQAQHRCLNTKIIEIAQKRCIYLEKFEDIKRVKKRIGEKIKHLSWDKIILKNSHIPPSKKKYHLIGRVFNQSYGNIKFNRIKFEEQIFEGFNHLTFLLKNNLDNDNR